MSSLSKVSVDHDEIRKWAEERGGQPSHVKATGGKADPGILRIDFPGYGDDDKLEPISWEEWFEKFDERELALIYEEKTAAGEKSNFNKLVSRDTVEDKLKPATKKKATASKRASSSKASPTARKSAGASGGKKKASASKK